tara:strand:+ start:3619 stop:4719 length:1101 start_codon:yes stop_codon:yes gene_type:complete
MDLIKQAISTHSRTIPGIEGYLTLVDKIEKNQNINPDICIESCKSLIEGLCLKALSLLSDNYNSNKTVRTKCKNNLTTLTSMAFDEVYSNYVESQIHESLANMLIDISVAQKIKDNAKRKIKEQAVETIGKVAAIRHERGDISHGRNYPKDQESSIKLAKSIKSITDGIASFMIEEIATQYLAKIKNEGKLIYEDLEEFNIWLDEKHNVLSIKIDFSKLLYENAYEKYEEFYYNEYVDLIESDEELLRQAEAEFRAIEKELPDFIKSAQKTIKEAEILVNKFNETEFWTEKNQKRLTKFAGTNGLLDTDVLKKMLEDLIAFDKKPIRSDVANIMVQKPPINQYPITVEPIINKMIDVANALKKEVK